MKTFNLEDRSPLKDDIKFGNLCQRRFYNKEFPIGNKDYFVDFSYVIHFTGYSVYDCNNYTDYITKIQLGYHLNRKTGEVVKGHIWIKDYESNKRATPEVYVAFKEWIEKNNDLGIEISREGIYDENVIYSYPDISIFEWSEEK